MNSTVEPGVRRQGIARAPDLFPITREWAYLQNASIGPLAAPVVAAVKDVVHSQSTQGTEEYASWLDMVESVRQRVATLLLVDPANLSFVRNTAEGLARVAFGLPWSAGDNVVTYAGEYPTNVLPWMALRDQGVELRLASGSGGRITVDDLTGYVDARTRLVALSSVQFATGYRLDVDAIGAFCRERRILFSVDAIQHLGVLPFDVARSPVDFVTAGAHKWLLAPAGSGVFYVNPEAADRLRVVEVGYAGMRNYSINDELLDFRLDFRSTAQRFEGGLQAFGPIAGLGAAAELLLGFGIDAISDHVLALTDRAVEGLTDAGATVLSPRSSLGERSGIVSFVHPRVPALEIKSFLAARHVSISVRVVEGRHVVRISPHLYNTVDEIDAFLALLKELVR